jgi:hypothetical protein
MSLDEVDRIRPNVTLSPGSSPPGITPTQARALASLLAGKSVTAAAKAAGVSRQTVWKWTTTDPEFLAFYNSCRVEMVDSIHQNILIISAAAVRALRDLLTRTSASDDAKLRAALEVLRLASRPIEGPHEVAEACAEIAFRKRDLEHKCLRAGLGIDGREILHSLYHPDRTGRTVEPDDGDLDEDLTEEDIYEDLTDKDKAIVDGIMMLGGIIDGFARPKPKQSDPERRQEP